MFNNRKCKLINIHSFEYADNNKYECHLNSRVDFIKSDWN